MSDTDLAPNVHYALMRPPRLDLDSFAHHAQLHPELVVRLLALGLLEAETDAAGRLWFAPRQLRAVARLQRLRAGLTVNYAALGVVMTLLDRLEALEAAQRRSPPPTRG